MVCFARCKCFLKSNVFLKSFGLHVAFNNEQQFIASYGATLKEMGCTDLQLVISGVQSELDRRRNMWRDASLRTHYIQNNYKPLDENLFHLKEEFFHEDFLKIMKYLKSGSIEKAKTLCRVHPEDVSSFPMFTTEFCNALVAEIRHLSESDMPKGKPNSMNNFGILLDEFGLNESFLTPLRNTFIEPLSQALYPDESKGGLDSHKAFTVEYEAEKDVELDFHFDNAEVTLNVCLLSDDCDGGELYFGDQEGSKGFGYVHQQGRAIMHRGRNLHCVLPLNSGHRINMVVWLRSSFVRNKICPMCSKPPDLETVFHGWGDGFTMNKI